MLHIKHERSLPIKGSLIVIIVLAVLTAVGYVMLLSITPKLSIFYPSEPMNVSALDGPKENQDRIVIPTLNVNIPYEDDGGESVLDRGAWWRESDRGNPEDGGNFIITARRFSMQPTPQLTVEKSPFYHLGKLKKDDPVIIDYKGKRYGYKITRQLTKTSPTAQLEGQSSSPKLTIYSFEPAGNEEKPVAFEAEPVGEVTTTAPDNTTGTL